MSDDIKTTHVGLNSTKEITSRFHIDDCKQIVDTKNKINEIIGVVNILVKIEKQRHRLPGEFDDWPSNAQMEYFKRGGR